MYMFSLGVSAILQGATSVDSLKTGLGGNLVDQADVWHAVLSVPTANIIAVSTAQNCAWICSSNL